MTHDYLVRNQKSVLKTEVGPNSSLDLLKSSS